MQQSGEVYDMMSEHHINLSRLSDILTKWLEISNALPDISVVRSCLKDDVTKIEKEIYYIFDKLVYRSDVTTSIFRNWSGKSVRLDIRIEFPERESDLKYASSRHRDIPNWSPADKESSKMLFVPFARLASTFFGTDIDKIKMKVWFNLESSRIECSIDRISNIHLNFYFEPGFPVRTFDESIWDE